MTKNDQKDSSANETRTNEQSKKVAFTTDYMSGGQESWVDQEISKLSERVKLIGGPNYWRLIVFIKDKLPMETESAVVDAVEMVRASHGKLNGLSRDQIFNETRKIIQENKEYVHICSC